MECQVNDQRQSEQIRFYKLENFPDTCSHHNDSWADGQGKTNTVCLLTMRTEPWRDGANVLVNQKLNQKSNIYVLSVTFNER